MSCPGCPCPGICLGWPIFCGWAAEEPREPVKMAHICARSGMPAPVVAPPIRRQPVAAPQALELVHAMKACPFRSTVGCGCSGAKCGLRRPGRQAVSFLDCFECLGKFGP